MPPETTVPTEGNPPAPTPPAPAPTPPPAQPVVIPPSSTTLPDDTDWKAKYDGMRGRLMQLNTQWNERLGAQDETIKDLGKRLETTSSQLATAQEQVVAFTQQVESIPQLQEQANKVETLETMNQRLDLIMRYPQIINQTKVEEVEVEVDGEKQTQQKRANPVLDLLLSSNLQGEQYAALVAQMAQTLPAESGTPPAPDSPPVVGTSPPAPVQANEEADLQKQVWDAREDGNYTLMNELMNQLAALKDKQASKK